MSRKWSKRLAVFAGLGLILAGCGSNNAEIKKYAKSHGMSEIETAAFSSCARNTEGKKLFFPGKDTNLVLKEVPLDVCACQAKTMMTVFRDKKYGGHNAFLAYMANEKKRKQPRLSRKELVPHLRPIEARATLQESLQACVMSYRTTHPDRDAELFEVTPLPPDPPKKNKKAKETASAT